MKKTKGNIDISVLLFPVAIMMVMAFLIALFPGRAEVFVSILNDLFVNKMGFFYILMGLFVLGCCFWVSFSRFGKTRLGETEKPLYSNFKWGSMIFTSTMAADILYWSLIEWGYYYSVNPTGTETLNELQRQQIASTYPLFHWGPIPWSFYLLPSAAYAYMFYVKKRTRQTLSEACRPILKNKADGIWGKTIDIFAIVGLLGGTATTFSLATPLMSEILSRVLHIPNSKALSIGILLFVGMLFTLAVMAGMKAIAKLAVLCVWLFVALLTYVFFAGPSLFILESGVSGLGNMLQNFIGLATWTDPLRLTGDGNLGFPQLWTIFYWAYWIAWFVATPFFVAKISQGRTIRQLILGGMFFGLAGTYTSFMVFGNFGLYQQVTARVDAAGMLAEGSVPSQIILKLFETLPAKDTVLFVFLVAMIAFYATTFDAITLVVAGFCRKSLRWDEEPQPILRAFWSFVFILLPIALIWSESTLNILKTLSVVAAFPLSLIMLLIIFSFYKELKQDECSQKEKQ